MAGTSDNMTRLQGWVDRMRAGDPQAVPELIHHTLERLQRLTRKMLRAYPHVRRWEQTDDVLHNAVLRLQRSLAQMTVTTVPEFFRLAAGHIRRELIDLSRHYYGPEGLGAHHASDLLPAGSGHPPFHDKADLTGEPGRLAEWSEFHHQVEALPADEREVFQLLWYHGLSQAEVAVLLEVTDRTIRRRWRSARVRLYQALAGDRSALDFGPE